MVGSHLATRLSPYHRYGAYAGVVAVAKRLSHPWLQWGEIVVVEMPLRKRPEASENELIVRIAERADLQELATVFDRPLPELRARVDRGDRCYVGYRRDEPMHMRWITQRATEVPELGLWLWPEPGTIYIYDAVTHPGARGAGFSGQVGAAMDDALAGRDLHAKVCYVRSDNHAMWHALRRVPGPLLIRSRLAYFRRPGRAPRLFGSPQWPLSTDAPSDVAVPPAPSALPSTSATM